MLDGRMCLLAELSDIQNLIVVIEIDLALVPLGLPLVAGGRILAGGIASERNTRAPATASDKHAEGPRSELGVYFCAAVQQERLPKRYITIFISRRLSCLVQMLDKP